MPHLSQSAYSSPLVFKQGHFSTIYSGAIQKIKTPNYDRQRLELPDGDFLLVDQKLKSSEKAVILCHGLEGSSRRSYNNSCADYFLEHDYSVFAWNNRSCGGEMNRLPQLYHHASVDDLKLVVDFVAKQGYKKVCLVGFSLGGAQIMSYFSRREVHKNVKAGVAVSTPIQLKSSAQKIEKGFSRIYLNRFVKKIKRKLLIKSKQFPQLIKKAKVKKIKSFNDLAQNFIVPVHQFKNLDDYFLKASPGYSMEHIKTPTLLLNAWDDPIIGKAGFPVQFAKQHEYVFLETPRFGGHCGFPISGLSYAYSEIRALEFFKRLS